MKVNWVFAGAFGSFLFLFVITYIYLGKKNVRECAQNEQKGIITVRLPPVFYRIMLGCTAVLSVVYFFLIVFPNESVDIFVYTLFGAFVLLSAAVTVMMRLWKIEFGEIDDFFLYRSAFGIRRKIRYQDLKSYQTGTNTITLKTQNKTFFVEVFSLNIELFLKQIRANKIQKQPNNEVHFKTSHKVGYLLIAILWAGLTVFVGVLPKENGEEWLVYVFAAVCAITIYAALRAFLWKINIHRGLSFFEYKSVFKKTRPVYYKDCMAKGILRDYILIKYSGGYIIINKNMENIDRLQKAFRANGVKEYKK